MSKQKGEIGAGETSRVPGAVPLLFNHTGLLCFFVIPSLSLPQGLCTCCSLYLGPSSACSLHDYLFAAFRSQLTCHLLREVLPNHQLFSTVSPGFFKACGTTCKDCPHLFVCFFSAPPLDYKFHESGDCVCLICSISPGPTPASVQSLCSVNIGAPHSGLESQDDLSFCKHGGCFPSLCSHMCHSFCLECPSFSFYLEKWLQNPAQMDKREGSPQSSHLSAAVLQRQIFCQVCACSHHRGVDSLLS